MADIRDYLDELLPPGTTDEQVDAAILHVSNAWWPQLCRSSRNSLIDCNLFEDAWYDENDLLDIHNPAYGTIVKALCKFFAYMKMNCPDRDVNTFHARWVVNRTRDKISMRLEGPKNAEGHKKCFRLDAPPDGWMDFQAEIDALRAMRDSRCTSPKNQLSTFVVGDPKKSRMLTVPLSDIPSNHGALAFSPEMQKSIAKLMAEALIDNPPPCRPLSHSALSSIPDGKTTSSEVFDWMNVTHADAYGWDGTQHVDTPTDAASKAENTPVQDAAVKNLENNHSPTTSSEQRFADHDLADLLPTGPTESTEKKDEWDEWDKIDDEWVKVGDDDFDDEEVMKSNAAKYKYTKKDATPTRKGWMVSLFKGKKKKGE